MAAETKIIITAATAQAEGALRGLGNSVSGLGSKFAAITGIGGALSITAFAGFIKSSIDAADRLDELAQITGTSVENLAGLQYAAEQNGASLETVARAGQKLSVVMSDKPELFKKMGISATDSTDAMVQLADMFRTMPDGMEKSALAAKLFGDRLGQEMILFLNQGTEAMRANIAQGREYNPVTAESARQAAEFNDQLDALKSQAGGLGMKLANDLLPGLVETTTAMSDLAREGHQVLALWRGLAGMGKVPWDFLMPPANLRKELSSEGLVKDLQAQIGQLERNKASGSGKLMQWIFGTPQEIDAEIAMLKQRIEIIRRHAAELDKPHETAPTVKPDGSKGRALLGELGGDGKTKKQKPFDPEGDFWFAVDEAAMKNQQKRNEEYLKELVKAEDAAQQEMQRSALEAQRIIADLDPIYKAGLAWEDLAALVEQGLLTQEQAGQAYKKSFDDLAKAGDDSFKSLENAVRGWGNEFTDEMTKMVRTGKMSFSSLADSIINDLIRIQVQKNITDPLVKAGTSFFDGMFGGMFGGGSKGGSPSMMDSLYSFDGGGYTGMGSRSGGIDGRGGFPAILHPNETVIDHAKGGSAKGGDTYYIDARGADQSAIARLESLILSINGSIERRALGAVNQALVSRGQQPVRA